MMMIRFASILEVCPWFLFPISPSREKVTAQRTETFHHLNQASKEKRPKPMIALGWEASLAGKPVMPQRGDRLGFEVMIPTNAAGCQAIFPAYLQYVDWVNLGLAGLCLKLLLEEHSQPWYLRMSKRRLSEWMTIWSRKKIRAHQHGKTIEATIG
jgi:hypothetical protein